MSIIGTDHRAKEEWYKASSVLLTIIIIQQCVCVFVCICVCVCCVCVQGWRKVINSRGLISQQEKFSMVKS